MRRPAGQPRGQRPFRLLRAEILLLIIVIGLGLSPHTRADAKRSLSWIDWQRRTTWRTSDGLPTGTVQSILQDRSGHLLLGLHGSLVRFDGVRFTRWSTNIELAPETQIRSLFQDSGGTIWAATLTEGLLQIDGDRIRRFTVNDGLPANNVSAVCRDREGVLWIGTTAGIVAFDHDHILPGSQVGGPVVSLACSPDGNVWVAPGAAPAWRMAEGRPVALPASLQSSDSAQLPINHIHAGPSGAVYLGATTGEVIVLGNGQVRRYGVGDGLGGQRVMALVEDRHGNLLVGSWGGGVARLTESGFIPLELSDGLASDSVTSLVEDREGNIWVGTHAGLTRLTPRPFVVLSARDGLPGDPIGPVLALRDGSTALGTDGGGLVHISATGNIRVIDTAQGLYSNHILSLAQTPEGEIFIGTNLGVVRAGPTCQTFSAPFPDTQARPPHALHVDHSGKLWAFGWRRLGWLNDKGSGQFNPVDAAGAPWSRINAIASDVGGLWIGADDGLFRIAENTTAPRASRVPGVEQVHTLAPDPKQGVWIASHDVLTKLDERGVIHHRWTLPDRERILAIVIDHDGYPWIGSQTGLLRVDPASGRTMKWDSGDGLLSGDFSYPGVPRAAVHADGRLALASAAELLLVDPRRLAGPGAPPVPVVDAVIVDGVALPAPPLSGSGQQALEIAPGPHRVDLSFSGLSFLAPEKMRFRFRLDGFDSHWIDAGTRRFASYTNLPPGSFVFRVSAANRGGRWYAPARALPFTIEPHIYQRRPVQVAMFLVLFAGFPIALVFLRSRRMRTRFSLLTEERNRIARELHDSLEQGFTGALLHLRAAQAHTNDQPDVDEHLRAIRAIVNHMHADTRHHIWDLRGRGHTHADLASALNASCEQLKTASPITHSLVVSGEPRPLPQNVETTFLRVFQEAITNVHKHANAKNVWVTLQFNSTDVALTITDDGCGFDPDAAQDGERSLGLIGMYERVERIDAQIEIDASPGAGTSIRITARTEAHD